MGLLPDIEGGEIKLPEPDKKLFTPPKFFYKQKEKERLGELNNLRREKVTEDFSDSPHLK